MKVKEIVCALERFAPLPLQDGWDNAGLQVGLTEAEVTGALLCLDVTEAVVDEAVALGYNLIVSHHPLIFGGLKSITGRNYVERCVLKAIQHGISICSHHTNMDNAMGGVNYKIAEKLGLNNLRILVGSDGQQGVTTKVEPTLQKAPGEYNDTLLAGLDFLLAEMGKRQMKAVLYLNNSWEWSGGYSLYLQWSGHGKAVVPAIDGWPAYMEYVKQFVFSDSANCLPTM